MQEPQHVVLCCLMMNSWSLEENVSFSMQIQIYTHVLCQSYLYIMKLPASLVFWSCTTKHYAYIPIFVLRTCQWMRTLSKSLLGCDVRTMKTTKPNFISRSVEIPEWKVLSHTSSGSRMRVAWVTATIFITFAFWHKGPPIEDIRD